MPIQVSHIKASSSEGPSPPTRSHLRLSRITVPVKGQISDPASGQPCRSGCLPLQKGRLEFLSEASWPQLGKLQKCAARPRPRTCKMNSCRRFLFTSSTATVWVLNMLRPLSNLALWSCPANAVRPPRAAFVHSSPQIWKNGKDSHVHETNPRRVLAASRSFLDVVERAKLRKEKSSTPISIKSSIDETSEKFEFASEDSDKTELQAANSRPKAIPRVGPVSDMQISPPQETEEEYKFEGPKRCGTVAIVGAPNAGKSTLMNHMVGSKVAIVTHKRQTTRNSVTGIGMEGGTQVASRRHLTF